jgi:predicted aldo/keto reductase-like oxidoreductase
VLCRNLYNSLPAAQRASACLECGICEEKCPQRIRIGEMLGRVRKQFP